MTKEKFSRDKSNIKIGPTGHVDHGKTTIDNPNVEASLIAMMITENIINSKESSTSTTTADSVPSPNPSNPISNIDKTASKERM